MLFITYYLSYIFLIWPLLEARAEIQKYFRWFFGSNEKFRICFRDWLTFRISKIWFNVPKKVIYTRAQNVCPGRPVLWSKMPMFQRTGMREGGLPLPPAFEYLILMTWRACNLDLVMVSSLPSKGQGLKVGLPIFQFFMKWNWRPLSSKSWHFEAIEDIMHQAIIQWIGQEWLC